MVDFDHKESLCRRVYYAARDGMAITLYALLTENKDPSNDSSIYLDHLVYEDGQKCTPLVAAAKNGHTSVVRSILNNFKTNIEQEATVQLDGYMVEGATALWCAAGSGHLNIVKLLLAHGANVDHYTKTRSTPLRAACFDGILDIVQYLVENGADIHITNRYDSTCLMIAAFRGHISIVSYLIKIKANINAQAECGATALHFAAEHGHLDIIKELLRHGAKIMKNKIGLTPIMIAAERTKAHVVEVLIKTTLFTKEECIEALELLGASYANDKDNYSLEKAYYYLERAMENRKMDDISSPKKLLPSIPAYNFHIECQTIEELQAIKSNSNALHMESLVIRERILGQHNPDVPHPVVFRGAVFADVGRFDKCIELWLHALYLRQKNKVAVRKDLLRFAQLFSQILHIGENISFKYFEKVLYSAKIELQKNIDAISSSSDSSTRVSVIEELEDNIFTILYLLVISTKLIKKFTPQEEESIYQLVYNINKLNVTSQNGSTFLHLAVNADTPVDDFHTKNVCKFPCAPTTQMLIQCGADVNAVDKAGNTPLHIIVAYQKPITDFMTLHSIINQLIEAGTHIDAANHNGETPSDSVLTGVAEIILRVQCQINLQCLAARAIRKFSIPYENNLPPHLRTFTDMHGAKRKHQKLRGHRYLRDNCLGNEVN